MATRKYCPQTSIKSISSSKRILVRRKTTITTPILNYIQIFTSKLISKGKIKDAILLEKMLKWYDKVDEKRRFDPVFEPWMLTTDFYSSDASMFNNILTRLLKFSSLGLSALVLIITVLVSFSGLIKDTHAQNNPARVGYNQKTNFYSEITLKYYLQNNVTGIIKSVPNNDPIIGKITFEDINTGIKYAKEIGATGQFSIQIPEGTYKREIGAKNHYLFIDTLNITSDTTLNKEMIKNLPVNSQAYINANKSSLWIFKSLTSTLDNNPISRTIHRFVPTNGDTTIIPTYIRRYNPNDPISMPQTWTLQYDTLMNYLTNNNPINDKLQVKEKTINDSLHNIQHLYVENNSMPIPGTLGYTLRFQENNILKYSKIFMNRQAMLPTKIVQTGLREFVRSFGLESNSIDPLFVMYTSGNSNRQLHPDEINIIRTLYSLTPGTDMFQYKDSVITVVNMPPIVTASLPNLNIQEGANETFLAKLSQHFRDPENSPLNYNIINDENIIVNLRNDSLFVKPIEGFSGITNLIVEAYDADGNGQFVADTSEINVAHINYPPTAARIINPQNGDTTTANYIFKWIRSTDQNNDPIIYTAKFIGDTNKTIENLVDTLYQFNNVRGILGENKNYKLVIIASDGIANTNSDTVNFNTGKNIQINHPPTAATLTNPKQGDTIITKDYIIKWTKSTDQDNDPLSYKIILTGTKDTTIAGITDTSYQMNNLREKLPIGNYTGKIETSDGINSTLSQANNFYITTVTGLEDEITKPNKFVLSQNYPNPFNPETIIRYTLPKNANVKVIVYNTLGEEVAKLVDGIQTPNFYEVKFNATGLASGVYFYRIESSVIDRSENFNSIKKMIVLK